MIFVLMIFILSPSGQPAVTSHGGFGTYSACNSAGETAEFISKKMQPNAVVVFYCAPTE